MAGSFYSGSSTRSSFGGTDPVTGRPLLSNGMPDLYAVGNFTPQQQPSRTEMLRQPTAPAPSQTTPPPLPEMPAMTAPETPETPAPATSPAVQGFAEAANIGPGFQGSGALGLNGALGTRNAPALKGLREAGLRY